MEIANNGGGRWSFCMSYQYEGRLRNISHVLIKSEIECAKPIG